MLLMIDRRADGRRATTVARGTGLFLRALGVIEEALRWPSRIVENRRLIGTLAAMTDHDLRDIGLTRQDLRDATALPVDRDPSRLFAARAAGRRGLR